MNPVQAVAENRARQTAVVTSANLTAPGIEHQFIDYGDGNSGAPRCSGKHAQPACLQADWDHRNAESNDEVPTTTYIDTEVVDDPPPSPEFRDYGWAAWQSGVFPDYSYTVCWSWL
ncbi:hypothetical protein [Glycomyces tarimensis]